MRRCASATVGTILGRKAHDELVLTISLEDRGRLRAAGGRLHDRVDVPCVQAIARGFFAVDRDVEVGLAQHAEYSRVFDALDLVHLMQHLVGQPLQDLQVGADDLDRVGALDAGQALLDDVLNVL